MSTGIRTALLLLLALPLFAACKTGLPSSQGEHWVVDSVPMRMVKRFTGYRPDLDGNYIDFQYGKKKSINRTLRRHFLNNSADNPFEASDPSQTSRRHAHSIAPDPLHYMHVESIVIGFATLGIWGTFVPIPVDSMIGTVTTGWFDDWDGFGEFVDGFVAAGSAKTPPSVGSFRVKNR
jgi:hypothetical protein